ncbi:DsbA family protein [Shewanella maritima]|uniref:DsbA family protein n=1 Tax=Shewanella maritima TaxID=2520507 RepID=A0A411PG82_9GAMM|nr:DsbA family protein [Shewanella maritima]QBF82555.1 DsbA family protein [Shewanella maritima]
MRLLYVMDPMCGWCYGFQGELEAFLVTHPEAKVDWIMGGLAPDTTTPMDENLKQTIASYWHQIESKTQVSFNHDFWRLNTPYRSTYGACRAVIAAEKLMPKSAQQMVKAIQSAYYQKALNPSLDQTLIGCAGEIGIDKQQFKTALNSKETEQSLQQHLQITRQLQVSGFPALFYVDDTNHAYRLASGYCTSQELIQNQQRVLKRER